MTDMKRFDDAADANADGRRRTLEPMPGWRVEWGPHSFTSRAYALLDLAEVLGIGGRAVRLGAAAKARFLVRGGRLRHAGRRRARFRPSCWLSPPEVPATKPASAQ